MEVLCKNVFGKQQNNQFNSFSYEENIFEWKVNHGETVQ